MSDIPRFAAYAAAFEKAVENDDWSDLIPFFHEDADYEIGLPLLGAARAEGREAVLAWFKEVLDRFDRRFDSRTLDLLDGPEERDGAVWIRGSATYRAEGVPDLVLVLEELCRFDGDVIVHLEDRYTDEMKRETEAYVKAHGASLGIEFTFDS